MISKFSKAFSSENIATGYLYFYVHFVTEICCFFALARVTGNAIVLWMTPLIYDFAAFVPQSVIGYFCDKHPKFKPGIIGTIVLSLGMLSFYVVSVPYIPIVIVCIGNALLHVAGAEVTLRTSKGKLSHSAIFVGGGSFGIIIGRLLGAMNIPMYVVAIAAFTMIPFILLADTYEKEEYLSSYNYASDKVSPVTVLLLATFIVIVRGYMAYGIPTGWNKTTIQAVYLFFIMGIGKCLGGILCDAIGMKKTIYISMLTAVPFLIFGDRLMVVSLIGVMFFSMTMPITLGLLTSILKKAPGLAFGFTTIGLFLGTLPTFFYRIKSVWVNCIIIVVCTIVCFVAALYITQKNGEGVKYE